MGLLTYKCSTPLIYYVPIKRKFFIHIHLLAQSLKLTTSIGHVVLTSLSGWLSTQGADRIICRTIGSDTNYTSGWRLHLNSKPWDIGFVGHLTYKMFNPYFQVMWDFRPQICLLHNTRRLKKLFDLTWLLVTNIAPTL